MSQARVLIVDDETCFSEQLCKALALHDFETSSADNGFHALEMLHGGKFDVVVTDFSMPGMDGATLTHRVKSVRPKVPVVAMSSSRNAEKYFLAMGSRAFLHKPFQVEQLLQVLLTVSGSMKNPS